MSWLEWLRGGRAPAAQPDGSRWIALDVETSGLDARRDRLIAIAAIALRVDWPARRLAVCLGDSFEVVLRQPAHEPADRDNILLHGIGLQRQRDGVEPAAALQAFANYAGAAPLLAFHSAFDETMIQRHARAHLGRALPNAWVDIEHLCAVTHEDVRARSLDDWMTHFGIVCHERHQAAADTLAECEVLLRVWPRVAAQCASWAEVKALAAQMRWIPRA